MKSDLKWIAWIALASSAFSLFDRDVLAASPQTAASPGPASAANQTEAPSILYGTVRSLKNQSPLPNVPVVLTNVKSGLVIQGTTTTQGSFIFSNLPPGDYNILVGGGNYSVQRKEGLLKSGTVGEMDFAINQLSQGSSEILGNIYEGHGDQKIPLTSTLAVKNLKTKEIYQVASGPSGTFDLKNIPSGDYLVQAIKRGYIPYAQKITVNGTTKADIRLRINRLAQATINASSDKKIKNTTGAISIVNRKKFAQNLTTGASYALMLNSPSIEYFSRTGSQGISGGMNYFSCRGYTVGAANSVNTGVSGIEISIDGVPMNIEADGGEIYDLGVMNADIASATIQRGVTTSRQMGNYAAGCAINFNLVEPSKDSYNTITSGGGSYGLFYTSYINNSGIDDKTNTGMYNDFSVMTQNGFREFMGDFTEYQYYGNVTKYLNNGKLFALITANYKNYDRGSAISLQDYNQFGTTYNGAPNFGENTGAPNGVNQPNSPFYKNWNYARMMFDIGYDAQILPSVKLKNTAFGEFTPNGSVSLPAATTGSVAGTGAATGLSFNTQSSDYNNQYGSPYMFNYFQAEGMKIGDIPEVQFKVGSNDKLYLGMRGSYADYRYFINPLYNNITGGSGNAMYSQVTIGGYLEDHYRPADWAMINAGFRVMSVQQYYNDLASPGQQALLGQNGAGGEAGVSNGGGMLVPMPHLGINFYPTRHWKIYANAGESYAPPAIFAYKGQTSAQLPLNIQPETIWDFEIGTRYSTKKGFIAGDLFSDYISNMFNNIVVPITSNGVTTNTVEPSTAGTARQQGIELEGKVDLGAGFGLEANYSYIEAVLTSDIQGLGLPTSSQINTSGDLIPFVPQGMGNLAVTYDHGPFHLTVDERYTGVMNVIDFSGGPTGTGNYQANSPAYFVTDLFATYDLPKLSWYKKANLFASAYNLFNTNYYNPAGLSPGGNNLETLFVYPGEPVNVFAGISMTF
ncbi:MAG: TonB-dependent receptor [Leptospirales bacterium]